jgi:hypothetical protein
MGPSACGTLDPAPEYRAARWPTGEISELQRTGTPEARHLGLVCGMQRSAERGTGRRSGLLGSRRRAPDCAGGRSASARCPPPKVARRPGRTREGRCAGSRPSSTACGRGPRRSSAPLGGGALEGDARLIGRGGFRRVLGRGVGGHASAPRRLMNPGSGRPGRARAGANLCCTCRRNFADQTGQGRDRRVAHAPLIERLRQQAFDTNNHLRGYPRHIRCIRDDPRTTKARSETGLLVSAPTRNRT